MAIVLHGNQHLLAARYKDRPGAREVAGSPGGTTGIRPLLALHAEHAVPLNLHLSGTLVECLAWHDPDLLGEVADLAREGLVEVVGSAFSQNILPLFGAEHNRRQLTEELGLLSRHLGLAAGAIRTFWVPERVWNTPLLAPLLRDPALPNGGYRAVVLDDRLALPAGAPRDAFDATGGAAPDPAVHAPFRIARSGGLTFVPGCSRLASAVPCESPEQEREAARLLAAFSAARGRSETPPLLVYMEDLERPAGIPPWSPEGLRRYERFLAAVASGHDPVLLTPWLRDHPPAAERAVDPGCFRALAREFGAGEDYTGWSAAPGWAPYAAALAAGETAVLEAAQAGGDPDLLALAWHHVLASAYETAWHDTPACVHANTAEPIPAPWARTIARHALTARPLALAARAAAEPPSPPRAEALDVDGDGETEVLLRTERVALVISPSCGGRLVLAFRLRPRGALLIGNPTDDWNWLERLNDYMDDPPNHPGAFTDVGHEHAEWRIARLAADAHGATVALARGSLRKTYHLPAGTGPLEVHYEGMPPSFAVEVGLSPDYLTLLREGIRAATQIQDEERKARGWRTGDAAALLALRDGFAWGRPGLAASRFPHGFLLRVDATESEGSLRLHLE